MAPRWPQFHRRPKWPRDSTGGCTGQHTASPIHIFLGCLNCTEQPLNIFTVARNPFLGSVRGILKFDVIPPLLSRASFAKVEVGDPAGLLVLVAVLAMDGSPTSAKAARHGVVHGHGEKH